MATLKEDATLDWASCPFVEVNPLKVSGAPILKGTRMPVEAILENHQDGLQADEIAELFELPVDSVRELLACAMQHNRALHP